MNLKNKIKQDLESKLDINLSFDISKLEVNEKRVINPRKVIKYTSLALASSLLIAFMVPIINMLDVDTTYNEVKRRYSLNEIEILNNTSFQKMNEVKYPSSKREIYGVSEDYKNALNNFTNNVYNELDKDNVSFSPLGLYSNLNIISLASDNESLLNQFDDVLGLNKSLRRENFKNMYRSNFFANEEGTLQMYNAVFQSNKWKYNEDFINELSEYYTESYVLDFDSNSDVNKMLDWIDSTLNEHNYLSKKDLEINELTALYFFTSIYFNNEWNKRYLSSDNYRDDFYNLDGSKVTKEYMNHIVKSPVYIYDDYISVYDSYKNNMSIQYIVPKEVNANIYDLVNDVNFLYEDESKLNENYFIDLSVPKFDFESNIDFKDILKSIGLDELFNANSLNRAFEYVDENGFSLEYIKQKNNVEFSELGTVIKSFTISMGAKGTSLAPLDTFTLEVKLNSPFIYVIRDVNGLPLYIGNVSNL